MNKIKMGTQQFLNPRPAILVGTIVNNKPNFITVSWAGITNADPPTMSIAIRKNRYSLKGILGNKSFSVNIPSASQIKETDYCGVVSGAGQDKVKACDFKLFYGNLSNAPMIEQCPVNFECEVVREVDSGDHILIFGEIIESYISENCFKEGIPDIEKINPLCFCSFTSESMGYYKLGEFIGHTPYKNK